MLTNEDIQKLVEVFATKKEFAEFTDSMRADFANLQTAIDGYAKRAETIFQELLMLTQRVSRLEKWIQQIAEKTGVKLES